MTMEADWLVSRLSPFLFKERRRVEEEVRFFSVIRSRPSPLSFSSLGAILNSLTRVERSWWRWGLVILVSMQSGGGGSRGKFLGWPPRKRVIRVGLESKRNEAEGNWGFLCVVGIVTLGEVDEGYWSGYYWRAGWNDDISRVLQGFFLIVFHVHATCVWTGRATLHRIKSFNPVRFMIHFFFNFDKSKQKSN